MDDTEIPTERIIRQPPSCIESCPAYPWIFLIGTYKLDDSQDSSRNEETTSQSRSGRVEAYQIKKKFLSSSFGISQCIEKYDFPDCAVLDLHFCPQDVTLFAVCTSTSQMFFFRLVNFEHNTQGQPIHPLILEVGSLDISADHTILATSFAWDPHPVTADPNNMSFAVTFSSGEVKLFGVKQHMKPKNQYDFRIMYEASIDPGHMLEAWTVVFADLSSFEENGRTLLTGGDDSILAFHSIQSDSDSGKWRATQLFQDRKSHTAGVTAILPIFDTNQTLPTIRVFVTGSYDEHLRVFTLEESLPQKRKIVADIPLGGGVWRLRKMADCPEEEDQGFLVSSVLLLACCMHAGIRIVRIIRRISQNMSQDSCRWEIDVIGKFTERHDSMCYAADSVDGRKLVTDNDEEDSATRALASRKRSGQLDHGDEPPRDFIVVSTSFYDKKICVWNFHNDEMMEISKMDTQLEL
jgi:diphthine methyl ester acylhydrolase